MTKHASYSRLWTTAVALTLVLGSALLSGQDATTKHGIPKDWSMHHVVFSRPHTAAQQKVLNDPRYLLQQELRAAAAAGPSMPAPPSAAGNDADDAEPDIAPPPGSGQLSRGLTRALVSATGLEAVPPGATNMKRIHKDWSEGLNSSGTSGLGQFPGTFTQTGNNCTAAFPAIADYAVYNTGLAGSGTQATIVAYNKIYASCSGGPAVYFAYNTGAAPIANSIDLSRDGTQMAFITGASGSAANVVILKWANSGGTVSLPASIASVAAASYRTCTAPCYTTVAFGNGGSDTYSSPFYDYHASDDALYVGDDGGKLHKFTGVFFGAPAEAGSPWPVQVSSATTGGALGSPIYDANTSLAFVGDYLLNYASTCEPSATNSNGSCGYLYSVNASGTVVQSHQLDYQYGIVDSPLIDVTTGQVYAFVGADNTTACSSGPCAGVFQFAEAFTGGATGTEAQVGAGYEFMLSGAFDNSYFSTGAGHLYTVGGTGPQNNTLYQIAIASGGALGAVVTGPAVAANYTSGFYAGGLQVTEFYTGTHDYIFLRVLMASTNTSVGQVAGYDVTSGTITTSTGTTGTIATQGGSSGIVVDNSLSIAQNIYYSSLLNATCTTSGTGGCAVQVIQSAP